MIIDKTNVSLSIWIMLPVFMLTAFFTGVYNGDIQSAIGISFMVLFYSAIIWIPSMIFTAVLEQAVLNKNSTKTTVAGIFGVETAVTFIVIALVFGDFSMAIPLLAVGLSIVIQLLRWVFLIKTKLMYKGAPAISEQSDVLDH